MNDDLQRQIVTLRGRLATSEQDLRRRLTPRQARDIIDENNELRKMNETLLRRNEILARKLRHRPADRL